MYYASAVFKPFLFMIVLAGIPQSLWSTGAVLSLKYGLGWIVLSTGVAVIIVCGLLFQAERLLAYDSTRLEYTQLSLSGIAAHPTSHTIFYASACIGSVLLASHHMLVAIWQTNISWNLLHDARNFPNAELVLTNQAQLIGTFKKQALWLFASVTGVITIGLLLYRLQVLLWGIIGFIVLATLIFSYEFMQLTASAHATSIELPTPDFHIKPALELVLASSLAGFGIVIGLRSWRITTTQNGWLMPTVIILACMYVLLILASWRFSAFSWFEETSDSDRLLLHIPYIFNLSNDNTIGIAWLVITTMLTWLKIALLLCLGSLLLTRLINTSLIWVQILLGLLVGLLTLSWIGTIEIAAQSRESATALLFNNFFAVFFRWWYPLHIVGLALLAYMQPINYHTRFAFRNNLVIAHMIRWSYVLLILMVSWIYMY